MATYGAIGFDVDDEFGGVVASNAPLITLETAQAQSAELSASITIDAAIDSSQAQTVELNAIVELSTGIVSSQAQTSEISATVEIDFSASSSQWQHDSLDAPHIVGEIGLDVDDEFGVELADLYPEDFPFPKFNTGVTIRANLETATRLNPFNPIHKSELATQTNNNTIIKSELATLQRHNYFVRSEMAGLVIADVISKNQRATPIRHNNKIKLEKATPIRLNARSHSKSYAVISLKTRCNSQHATALRHELRAKLASFKALYLTRQFKQSNAQIIRNLTGFDLEKATIIYRTMHPNFAPIVFVFNPQPYTKTTFIIPVKQVYQMQHTITVTLENGTPIDVNAVKLDLNNDSFAWQFSCNLLKLSQVDLVKQTEATPVVLVVTIDGYQFKMLCEKTVESRSFGNRSVSLNGRSLSALLAEPYKLPTSKTIDKLQTVEQIAQSQKSPDFKINWKARTWSVPANTFSFAQKNPAQVITDIAANIGACVVPSRNAKEITVQPRYSVFPRDFATVTPDLIIPDSAIINVTYRNVTQTQANGVYIHGDTGGILAKVSLKGTAGDRLASTVTNPLITHVNAARSLGEKILADNYQQPTIQSITIPLGGDYPLVEIGHLIRINIDGGQVFGIVNSVSIDANLDTVRQVIQIGNESTNVWQSFKKVMPQQPLLVGKLSIDSTGKKIITFKDGGTNVVRGDGVAGKNYYIRNGAIESEAPALEINKITI